MQIVGIHGRGTDGAGNIDLALGSLKHRGLDVVDVQTPKRRLSTFWAGPKDAQAVADVSKEGDILLSHSWGCYVAWHAHKLREYRAILCVAPAMSSNKRWWNPTRVYCYFSPIDFWVKVGSIVPFHPYGRAGVEGFRQFGVNNIECRNDHNYFDDPVAKDIIERVVLIASQ